MATVPKTNPPRVLDALKMKVGVRVPGSGAGYRILTGASVLDLPSGTRAVSQIPTFDGTATIAAAKSNENISFTLGVWQPHLPVHQDLARADANRLTVAGRMDIYAEEILKRAGLGATKTIGITALPADPPETSVAKGYKLTGAGLDDLKAEYFQTDLILVGDIISYAAAGASPTQADSYIVSFIEEDDTTGEIVDVYVTKADGSALAATPGGDVTAAAISAWEAGWRQPFSGKVNELRSHAADASGSPQLSSTVSFTPQGKLPPEQVLYVELKDSDWLAATA